MKINFHAEKKVETFLYIKRTLLVYKQRSFVDKFKINPCNFGKRYSLFVIFVIK